MKKIIIIFLFFISIGLVFAEEITLDLTYSPFQEGQGILVLNGDSKVFQLDTSRNLSFITDIEKAKEDCINTTDILEINKTLTLCLSNYSAELNYNQELADLTEGITNLKGKLNQARNDSEYYRLQNKNSSAALTLCTTTRESNAEQLQNCQTKQNECLVINQELENKSTSNPLIFGIIGVAAGYGIWGYNKKKRPQQEIEGESEGVLE